MPTAFVLVFVLILVGGIANSITSASRARRLASRTGESPGRAARRVLSSRNPQSELRRMEEDARLHEALADQRALLERATTAPVRTSEERLQEVQRLYEQGLINEDEASTKRREILDEL